MAEYAFALAAKVSFFLEVLLGEQASDWRQKHLIGDKFLVSNMIICVLIYLVATSKGDCCNNEESYGVTLLFPLLICWV